MKVMESVAKLTLTNHITTNGTHIPTFSIEVYDDQPELGATIKYFQNSSRILRCAAGNEIWLLYNTMQNPPTENYERDPSFRPSVITEECYYDVGSLTFGSARKAGEVGVTRLNLYAKDVCSSNTTVFTTDQTTVSVNFDSLLLVGDVPVELFLQPNFAGFSYCVHRSNGTYTEVSRMSAIGINPGAIRSLKFGCSPEANVIVGSSVLPDNLVSNGNF
jgi:hypothetical protein